MLEALTNLFEHDRSAARGQMAPRGLYLFEHDSYLGLAPAHELLERIEVRQRDGVEVPRSFDDFEVEVEDAELPNGVRLHRPIG